MCPEKLLWDSNKTSFHTHQRGKKKPHFFKQTPDLEKVPDVDVYRYVYPLVQLHPRESHVQTASEATVCTPAEPTLPFRTVGAAGEGQGTGSG